VLPIWTFLLLSLCPLPGLWDRLVYFAFLLCAEKFSSKLAIPILLLSVQMAPVVVQDWDVLRWARENLIGKALADPELRPSLLSVAQIPVLHGIGWKNETAYQEYINCRKTDPPVSSIFMKNPCSSFQNLTLAYARNYLVKVTTI
jgi:hypothetical protein